MLRIGRCNGNVYGVVAMMNETDMQKVGEYSIRHDEQEIRPSIHETWSGCTVREIFHRSPQRNPEGIRALGMSQTQRLSATGSARVDSEKKKKKLFSPLL